MFFKERCGAVGVSVICGFLIGLYCFTAISDIFSNVDMSTWVLSFMVGGIISLFLYAFMEKRRGL